MGNIHLYIHYAFFLISYSWHEAIPITGTSRKMEFQFFKFENLRDVIDCWEIIF